MLTNLWGCFVLRVKDDSCENESGFVVNFEQLIGEEPFIFSFYDQCTTTFQAMHIYEMVSQHMRRDFSDML